MAWETIASHCSWPRFAPKVEQADITFTPPPAKRILSLKLRVTGASGPVYESAEHVCRTTPLPVSLPWNGERNQGVPVDGVRRFVNPAMTPFEIEVLADTEPVPEPRPFAASVKRALSNFLAIILPCGGAGPPDPDDADAPLLHPPASPIATAKIDVQYHSIRLRRVPWPEVYPLPDKDNYPGGVDEATRIKWLQHRLNELGYFAGPVNGRRSGELTKAVMRYCHHYGRGLGERLFDYFPAQDDLVADRAGAVAALSECPCDDPPTGRFQILVNALQRRDNQVSVLDNPGVFENEATDAKLYVDNNVFYTQQEDAAGPPHSDLATIHLDTTSGAFVKADRESLWLTEPHVPLEVKVTIADHAGNEQDVPEAVGPARIRWDWESSGASPPLPGPAPGKPNTISAYVARAFAALNAGIDNRYKYNATVACGGLVDGDAVRTRASSFVEYPASSLDPGACHSDVTLDPAPPGNAPQGATRVYFRASTLGGDSYRVHAELLPARVREAIAGGILTRKSGWLRVWRRTRLAAYVQWPARTTPISSHAWQAVLDKFKLAFVEIDKSAMQTVAVTNAIVHDNPGVKGPEANQKSYYYSETPPLPFSPNATYPDRPVMPTGRMAADRLFAHRLVSRDCNDWARVKNLDGSQASPYVKNSICLAGFLAGLGGVAGPAGTHYNGQFVQRVRPDGTWEAQPADQSARTNLVPYDNGSVPADPVMDLENAINDLVKVPVDAILSNAARTDADRDVIVALVAGIKEGWASAPDPILVSASEHYLRQLEEVVQRTTQWQNVMVGTVSTRKSVTTFVFRNPLPAALTGFRIPDELVTNTIWRAVSGHCEKIGDTLNPDLQRFVRQEQGWGDGLIYLDAKPHREVLSVRGSFTYPGLNCGKSGGVFLTSQFTRNEMGHLIAHEMAHCMFLRHYKNAGNYQPMEHDLDDDNCVMSYGFNLGSIAVESSWSASLDCYVLTATFTNNDGVPTKFDRLVKFEVNNAALWLATTRSENDTDGVRRNQRSIYVVSEGYVAKARLYIDFPIRQITITATALSDVSATCRMDVPRRGKAVDNTFTWRERPSVPPFMLGGYGDGVHYHVPHNYKPEFCGKCNLILRGWKLNGTWPTKAI